MRSPSSLVLINTIDIFVGANARDSDGGFSQALPATPTFSGIPCTVQYTGTAEVIDAQNRVTNTNSYMIMFGSQVIVTLRDLIRWVEGSVTHLLYVEATPPSEAGRGGGPFTVRAIEKI